MTDRPTNRTDGYKGPEGNYTSNEIYVIAQPGDKPSWLTTFSYPAAVLTLSSVLLPLTQPYPEQS